ncbi:galactose-binding domain-containing protein [Nonomuraea jabiensis]|uniref:galactose-binding domain-containing protein n=1 Tax=Nonomuraea jabiensis TaxID=882448 RepID=UPI003F4E09B2
MTTAPRHRCLQADDGDTATRWCAADGRTGHWWQVDPGSRAALTGTEVRRPQLQVPRLQSPSTARAWTRVTDRTASTTTAQLRSDTFAATARYVSRKGCILRVAT